MTLIASRRGTVVGVALLALLTGCAGDPSGPGENPVPAVLHLSGSSGGTAAFGTPGEAGEMTPGSTAPTPGSPGQAGDGYNGAGQTWSGYRVVGALPTGPAAAPVQRFPGLVQISAVRALAGALGLTGAPVRHAHGWVVTGPGAATLRVRDDGTGQWSYLRAATSPWCLPQVDLDSGRAPTSGTVCSAGPVPPPGTLPGIPAGPSASTALAVAAPVLSAVGLPPLRSQARAGSPLTMVWVDPVVGGLPTVGLTTTVMVDRDGVLSADGWLGTPVPGADYPLVTAAQALRSLTLMAHPMMPVTARPAIAIACPAPAGTVSGPVCGGPIEITGAHLGLALRYEYTAPILVPAWLFSTAAKYLSGEPTYPIVVIAVQPRYLPTPTPPFATAVPQPTGPGSTGGGQSVPGQSAPGLPTPVEPAPGLPVGAGHGVGPG
ncbi:MAG: hypothetical protein ABI468_06650 [Candidatus Nanopelagicales bacterium]